mgnify:CR=1 FL=1
MTVTLAPPISRSDLAGTAAALAGIAVRTPLVDQQIARQAQSEFLSGFLGGPQLYFERHRHSNVRQMHAHLAIGTAERDAWLACMDKALSIVAPDPETRRLLMGHFSRVAEALRNQA